MAAMASLNVAMPVRRGDTSRRRARRSRPNPGVVRFGSGYSRERCNNLAELGCCGTHEGFERGEPVWNARQGRPTHPRRVSASPRDACEPPPGLRSRAARSRRRRQPVSVPAIDVERCARCCPARQPPSISRLPPRPCLAQVKLSSKTSSGIKAQRVVAKVRGSRGGAWPAHSALGGAPPPVEGGRGSSTKRAKNYRVIGRGVRGGIGGHGHGVSAIPHEGAA